MGGGGGGEVCITGPVSSFVLLSSPIALPSLPCVVQSMPVGCVFQRQLEDEGL